MRELTKSMLSLSWAMSLLGLKQMASLLVPGSNASSSFEAVTRCTEEQLGPATRPAFRAGDSLQRGLVDLTFSLFTFGLWRPGASGGNWMRGSGDRGGWGQRGRSQGLGSWGGSSGYASCSPAGMGSSGAAGSGTTQAASNLTAQAMGAGIDLMQQGVNLAYQMVGGAATQPLGNSGWGPVPPPPGGSQATGNV